MRQTSITRRKREVMESPKLTAILIVLGVIWFPAQGFVNYPMMINFQNIVDCVSPTLLDQFYSNYGCFCGIGEYGNQPVDDFDRCCQVHDDCYREVGRTGCPRYYMWHSSTCENGIRKCPDFSVMSRYAECVQKMCDCDIEVALCFKENKDKRNPKFVDYDRNLCKTVP
ncbi:acidic phospholipase A2 E-like [Scyliorhinus canicula]|uniref:acidic phospholipase A2 E-like n=1 Tax=Scyliorhinus canicula TaxID=7830 RepID=UPI0018F54F5C|nr:acidic phospholipase A2 E-like [Scyliorhinus canicula]